MSKNAQQNRSEIFLGNETYARGFNDGLNGRPKTIKKTHRHAHRYHTGYRHGQAEAKTTMQAALSRDVDGVRQVAYANELGRTRLASSVRQMRERPETLIEKPIDELIGNLGKPRGFWQRFKAWLLG